MYGPVAGAINCAHNPNRVLKLMRIGLAFISLGAVAIGCIAPAPAASIALVLAVDVSDSVSTERYMLQRDGIALAFETPRLVGCRRS